MAKKPSIEKAFEWTSEILEKRIVGSLDFAIKELEKAQTASKTGKKLPRRHVRARVKDYFGRIKSLRTQIKKLRRGLGGVILTNPEYYKETGLFRKIAEKIGNPEVWTEDLSEVLANELGNYGGRMADTAAKNQFNPAGKVGHHRTALSTLRDAIEPLGVDVRSEFKKLALADGYQVGEEFIDYIDPAAHKKFTKSISGALADKLGYTDVSQIKPKDKKLFAALAERSAHAAAFGEESGFFLPKHLIKEGANAEEVYKYAKPYLELSRRGAEAGLQLDDILTSNRWNTSEELFEIIQAEMPVQDNTPVLNRMRTDLMEAGLFDPNTGFRGTELKDAVGRSEFGFGGASLVPDSQKAGISPEEMYANRWEVPDEVKANAAAIAERTKRGARFTKAATGLNKADSLVRIAAGDYVGGGIGLAMQSNAFQKALAKRLAKAGSKLIPGVGIGMSALETAGYASQGRFTQAGIAAFSGAVGEVPIVGDLLAGGADLLNTGIDVATGNLIPDLDEDELAGRLRKASRYAKY